MALDLDAVETTPLIPSTSKNSASYNTHTVLYEKHFGSLSSSIRGPHRNTSPTCIKHDYEHEVDSLQESSSMISASTTYQGCTDGSDQVSCALSTDPQKRPPSLVNIHGGFDPLPACISLTLENHGSVARDHLALERTFLAYVRTSLALASSGVALVQLFTVASTNGHAPPAHRLRTYIRPLGATTIVMGLMVLFIGVARYFSVQAALTKGNFPVSRVMTGVIAVALTTLILLTFGILLAGKQGL